MEQKIQIVDVDYVIEEGESRVRVFGKTLDGENFLGIDKRFQPYLYALPGDPGDAGNVEELEGEMVEEDDEEFEILEVEETRREVDGDEREVFKVYTQRPPDIPRLKEFLERREEIEKCREYDIPFYKRYLIDMDLKPANTVEVSGEEFEHEKFEKALEIHGFEEASGEIEFNSLAFDLEVYDEKIIMASFVGDSFEKVLSLKQVDEEFVETVEDEKEMLERLMQIIEDRDIDILTGYNTDEFDFKKLRERAEEHDLELTLGRNGERMKFKRRGRFSSARLKGRMHLDLYPFVSHVLSPGMESETLDLDSVAEELLGKNKDDMDWSEMKEAWREEERLEEFARYSLKDSQLAYELGNEIVPQILELSRITGLIPFDACRLTYGQLTENFLLREAFNREKVAPNRPSRSERNRRRKGGYEGGFVYTPEAGLHEHMALFDFRSLYPTVMVAHNISPDTLELDDCEEVFEIDELGYSFCQDEPGFFPELVEGLVEERYSLKERMNEMEESSEEYARLDNRQQAEKILANSFYGYMGYSGARWYSKEAAEATTFLGRKYIEETIDTAEEKGFEVVYGDTDSVFLKKEGIRDSIDGFLEEVNDDLPEFMELEFEGYFERGLFTSTESGEGAKKKYALMDEEGNMKITGFEQVRRDWSPVAKETQEEVLRLVLQEDIEEAVELVKNRIQELKDGKIPVEKLRIYTTLNKKPENYESTAPHVEAAKRAKQRGEEISPGSTVEYVITNGTGNISSRAEITKFAEDYDSEYYIDNQVIPVALRVLKEFGYTEGQLKGKGKQSGLGRF